MSIRSEQVTKVITPFTLQLPEEFKISPTYTVELSASRVAEVYNTVAQVRDYNAGNDQYKPMPGWRVVVKTKRGTYVDLNRYERPEGVVFSDPLLLSLHLQKLSVEYAKKKKTTVEEVDLDD